MYIQKHRIHIKEREGTGGKIFQFLGKYFGVPVRRFKFWKMVNGHFKYDIYDIYFKYEIVGTEEISTSLKENAYFLENLSIYIYKYLCIYVYIHLKYI